MKRHLPLLLFLIFVPHLSAQEYGLSVYNAEKASPGVTLIPESGSGDMLLLDIDGTELKRWKLDAPRVRLLENCNLLMLHGTKWGLTQEVWRQMRDFVREYDFEGEPVWEYRSGENAHHDVHRLANGNTLFLRHDFPKPRVTSPGLDPRFKNRRIRSDEIVEVNSKGQVVWNWRLIDHFLPARCDTNICKPFGLDPRERMKSTLAWGHLNAVFPLPENKWFDAGDKRFRPGNIVITARDWSTVFIIDKKSGEPVWSYRKSFRAGLSGGHEAHMIEKGLPGAGNILIFDNGREHRTDISYILEVDPSTGKHVWVYNAGTDFFSHAAGSVQRLPNGNTLISEDVRGRVFEVTPEKEIVWSFRSKFRTARAKRYSYNYCPKIQELRESKSSRVEG